LNHLILDEADKLFELNFLEQTDEILAACQNSRPESKSKEGGVDNFVVRKGMFSATMPSSVEEMAKTVMAGAGSGLVRAIVGHKYVSSVDNLSHY
jgi:ATP-dependent RNA helicase DDX52/ROK1